MGNYPCHTLQAGITGKQQLPEKFQVTRSTGHDAPQDIFINREINMETWLLQGKVCTGLLCQH